MEKEKLIESLTEYIKWEGYRNSETDELLPAWEQNKDVFLAMSLLESLVG